MKKKNADLPANPITEYNGEFTGLTKREYFAGLAMQGIIGSKPEKKKDMTDEDALKVVAKISVMLADNLLKELEA